MAAQDKPKIALNLDTLEREGGTPEPFVVALGGRPYKLIDPQSISWENILGITQNPVSFLQAAVEPAKREQFLEALAKLPGWKVNALAEAYRSNYGLPSDPEALASPTS